MSATLDKVNENVKALSALLKAQLKVDTDGTINPEALNAAIVAGLPEDLPLETIQRAQSYGLDLADATSLAVAEVGLEALKANKDLDAVSLSGVKFGSDSIDVNLLRSRESRHPATGEKIVSYGALSMSFSNGIGAKRGNFKRIQEHTRTEAASIFGK